MTRVTRFVAIAGGVCLCLSARAAWADSFTLNCQGPGGPVHGTDSVVVVGCLLPGGGSFTGTAKVKKTDRLVQLTLTGAGGAAGMFSGVSTGMNATNTAFVPFLTTDYFLAGEGSEIAFFNGSLAGTTTAGGEFFQIAVFGTSFNPPQAANARWDGPGPMNKLPIPVTAGPRIIEGLFQGQGVAQLFVRFNSGGNTFNMPASADGVLNVVPEPATLLLVGSGIAFLGRKARNGRR